MKGKSLRVVSGPSQLIYGTLGALSHGYEEDDDDSAIRKYFIQNWCDA